VLTVLLRLVMARRENLISEWFLYTFVCVVREAD
jgi:hypothetical protein